MAPRKKLFEPDKLDVACGQNKQPEFTGIDIAGDCDIVHDLNVYPWPIKANSVSEVFCSHYVEHIPHQVHGHTKDGWFLFFDELYRICKPDAKLTFHHPYAKNDRAFWDPTHTRYIHETTWYYLDKTWRQAQGLDHYQAECDFEVGLINAGVHERLLSRNHEHQQYARDHYWNAIGDLTVDLRVRK